MTYTLYNRLGSGGFVAEAALILGGIDHHYEPANSLPNSAAAEIVGGLNAWGQVPVLVTPTGKVLTETAAIAIYLADTHPSLQEGPFLFVEDKAAFYRWSVFLAVNVYEGILRRCYPHRFIPDATAHPQLIDSANARVHEAFDVLEAELEHKSALCGSELSIADLLFAMLYAWHNAKPDLPRCTALTERVASHPEIAPIWRRNFDHRLDHDWVKAAQLRWQSNDCPKLTVDLLNDAYALGSAG